MNNFYLHLAEIWNYPIKSLRGIQHQSIQLDKNGLIYDRKWMLIDEDNVFITRRNYHSLALISLELNEDSLTIHSSINNSLTIDITKTSQKKILTTIWSDQCEAMEVSQEANEWFSDYLQKPVRLVYMPESTQRQVDEDYAQKGVFTNFTDGYPILIISEATLEDLNLRLETPIQMNRFRPNLVISGATPYEEDTWKTIKIGNVILDLVKPCARCIVTTIDPETGVQGKEPLQTLNTYRKSNNKIYFGQNAIHREIGNLQTGDLVQILEFKEKI